MYSKRCNSSVLGLLKASPYRSASPQVPYPLCQVSQKLVWVLLKWVWFQWGHGEGKFWQRVQIFIFILAMGVVWCLLCETCADFDVPHVAKPFTWFCDSRSSKSVTPQTNLQCNVSRKKKKNVTLPITTKVTLKLSVNMSSPTLMFGNFFGSWGWWGAISRLTCPATGLLVRGHPAHASTRSSAQARVEIWYTTCQRNRKVGSGMH